MKTQIVYLFEPATGLYCGDYVAQESPEEPGVFIVPEASTPATPPSLAANEAAVFDKASGAWTIVPDYRGQTVYDASGVASEVVAHGALPAGLSLTKPPLTLAQRVAHMDALVEELLNATAKRKGYAGSDRLAGYSASVAFGADALAFIAWRDAVWIHCTALLNGVMAGTAPIPTDAELLAGLPLFNAW